MKPTEARQRQITGRRLLAGIVILGLAASGLAYRYTPQLLGVVNAAYAATVSPALVQRMASEPDLPITGNPVGAVTIIEFFDYRCPYCRVMQPRLQALIAKDKRVRLVFKEWPIFGGASIDAARLALAAQWQGKYLAAHEALFGLPRTMDEASIRSALTEAGVDMTRLDHDLADHARDIDAQLRRNNSEAQEIGFQGTPGFVIGAAAAPGALSEAQLEALVDKAAEH